MKYTLLTCLLLWPLPSAAQTPGLTGGRFIPGQITSESWELLRDVTFSLKEQEYVYYPAFGSKIRARAGKPIELRGYIYPLEESRYAVHFMLTSLPLNACFFCGVGGPESVVEVEAKLPVKQVDKPVTIRGILHLNDSDPERMMYIIREAVLVADK
jgi:hypothetical protein